LSILSIHLSKRRYKT